MSSQIEGFKKSYDIRPLQCCTIELTGCICMQQLQETADKAAEAAAGRTRAPSVFDDYTAVSSCNTQRPSSAA